MGINLFFLSQVRKFKAYFVHETESNAQLPIFLEFTWTLHCILAVHNSKAIVSCSFQCNPTIFINWFICECKFINIF